MVDKSPPDRIRTITIAPVGLEGLLGLPMDPTGDRAVRTRQRQRPPQPAQQLRCPSAV